MGSYAEEVVTVGEAAVVKQHSHGTERTVYHLKRALGKKYADIEGEEYVKNWAFNIEKGQDGRVQAIVPTHNDEGDAHVISPEKFTTEVFKKMKQVADDFVGEDLVNTVITAPEYFTAEQTDALVKAATDAKLNVMNVISEPVAAAIAYDFDQRSADAQGTQYVLVFDMGGATHDVTLLSVDQGLIQVVATGGDHTLGGDVFTNALVDHCIKSFERKNKDIDLRANAKAMRRLTASCEAAKRGLSQQNQVNIEVDSIASGTDLKVKVSRTRYEDLIYDFLKKAIDEIEQVLEEGDLDTEHVSDVLLVGGSVRTPKLQAMIEEFFDQAGKIHVIPDEAIAFGATVEASARCELANDELPVLTTVGAVPLTLGLEAADGTLAPVINRNTLLPARATEAFTTSEDNQTAVFLKVYEGERLFAEDNTLLASVTVKGLPAKPAGEVQLEVTFALDTIGRLEVSAVDKSTNTEYSTVISIDNDNARLTAAQVEAHVKEAEEQADADYERLDELEAAALESVSAGVDSLTVESVTIDAGEDMD